MKTTHGKHTNGTCAAANCFEGNTKQLRAVNAPSSGIGFTAQKVTNHNGFGNGVVQAKTEVSWTSQDFPYVSSAKKIEKATVGNKMEAKLDPDEPIRGNDASSTHQKPFYESLKKYWNPGSKAWVRGHLLNANLGGPNVSVNLFPITGHANGDHLNYVENHVKKWVIAGRPVNYSVTAERDTSSTGRQEGKVDIPNAKGSFTCHAETMDSDDKQVVYRRINSNPAPKGSDPGHASTWQKHDSDKLLDEVDTHELSKKGDEIYDELMGMDSDDMLEVLDEEIEELSIWDRIAILKMVWGDEYEWEDEMGTEDTESDTPGGKVLNDKLGAWLNKKKLTKAQVEQWMKKKKVGTTNEWKVSS